MSTTSEASGILEVLVKRQALTSEEINAAETEAHNAGAKLERFLVDSNIVSDVEMALALSEYLNIPPISLDKFNPSGPLMDLIPKEIITRYQLIPVARTETLLTIAMSDPLDVVGLDQVQARTGLDVTPLIAPESHIQDIISTFTSEFATGLENVLRDISEKGDLDAGAEEVEDLSLDQMPETSEDAPAIRVVNSVMVAALRLGASDIHIEPMEKLIRLRYRIAGLLYESSSPPKALQAAIISRLKIMSNLDIAERRVPQDGRFKIRAMNKEVDIRLSLLPTVYGEKIVMRILDKTALAPSLSSLGLDQKAYEGFATSLHQPYGMILVTGPTGSGKTTTLYSGLQELNKSGVNIITAEDPVEYQLPGINQVQINADVGLTFASALRSVLRQDPDIVMVGEIRDQETASIAVKAALTGHLVLSTLHTNDAPGAISRLANMGIEPFLLASSVIMTQAQRLYRKLCFSCRREREIDPQTLRLNDIDQCLFDGMTTYEAVGCPKCNGIGYRSRGALMEILVMDDEMRELVGKETNAKEILKQAQRSEMKTLREVGMERVRDGQTSLEEILRVTSKA